MWRSRARRALWLVGITGSSAGILALLVSCLDDPRKDEEVTVTTKCDLAALNTDPASPESTLRTYVETTEALLERGTAVETAMREACNALNQELSLPTAQDAVNACKPLTARIQTVLKNQPLAPPGATSTVPWVDVRFPSTCKSPPATLEGCLAKCSGPCDTSKCEPGKLAGKCNGECLGTCSETGDAVSCTGKCVGQAALDGGSCLGECTGRCGAQAWAGACTGSCPAAFIGSCSGTCTGRCNGIPIGDAGDPFDAGAIDASSETGPPEAGPPGPPPVPRPPGGDDGNCKGICAGVCSSGANGDCKAPCLTFQDAGPPIGLFGAGFCGSGDIPGLCTGACNSATGVGTTLTCKGTCTQKKPQCDGVCRPLPDGGCNGTLTDTFCEGARSCNQNVECNNACQASALISVVCDEPATAQIFSVSDPALYSALQKHAGALGKVVNQLSALRNALSFIGNRAYGDFSAIGLSGDLARACVQEGQANVQAANVVITATVSANPTNRKYQ